MENVQNIPSAYISGNHEKFNCTTKKKKSIHYNPSYSMCAFSPHFSKPVVQITHQIAGAGGSFIREAVAAGADIFLTADLRYNDFFTSGSAMTVADVGHFESEYSIKKCSKFV